MKTPPAGFVSERVLRSMITSVARQLRQKNLPVRTTLKLLKEHRALCEQLQESAAARIEMELAASKSHGNRAKSDNSANHEHANANVENRETT